MSEQIPEDTILQEISPMAPMQQIEPQTFQGFTEIENLKHQDSEGEDDDESDDECGEEESENEGEEKSDDEENLKMKMKKTKNQKVLL